MLFSVIYSVDVPSYASIRGFLPRRSVLRHMDCTEGDEEYEYDYLEGCWEKGKHRKLVGLLIRPHFEALVEDCGLYAEDVETMGSIGAPGLFPEVWCAPAIAFNAEDPEAIQSMYVTPIPEVLGINITEERWERIRRAVIDHYGCDGGHRHFTKIPLAARGVWQDKHPYWGDGYARWCKRAFARARRMDEAWAAREAS